MPPRISTPTHSVCGSSEGGGPEALVVTTTGHSSPKHQAQQQQQQQQQVRSQSDSALPRCNDTTNLSSLLLTSDDSPTMPKRRISFNDRVLVREFDSGSWDSVTDMQQWFFPHNNNAPQYQDLSRQQQQQVPQVILCHNDISNSSSAASCDTCTLRRNHHHYDYYSLKQTADDGVSVERVLKQEIRNVLVVDPHDIFLRIFTKRLQQALPHVSIWTAHSAEEALVLVSSKSDLVLFDMIIAEERLSLFHRHAHASSSSSISSSNNNSDEHEEEPTSIIKSGSALLQYLQQQYPKQFQQALMIGVSAHWQSDHVIMEHSGATDYCWNKAIQPNNLSSMAVLEDLLHTLLLKRGKHDLVQALLAVAPNDDDNDEEEGEHKQQQEEAFSSSSPSPHQKQ